jgi:hypothetical protein
MAVETGELEQLEYRSGGHKRAAHMEAAYSSGERCDSNCAGRESGAGTHDSAELWVEENRSHESGSARVRSDGSSTNAASHFDRDACGKCCRRTAATDVSEAGRAAPCESEQARPGRWHGSASWTCWSGDGCSHETAIGAASNDAVTPNEFAADEICASGTEGYPAKQIKRFENETGRQRWRPFFFTAMF